MTAMDTQVVELIGRQYLIAELLVCAGLEVATPIRDPGIDLIAYADIDERITRLCFLPYSDEGDDGAVV